MKNKFFMCGFFILIISVLCMENDMTFSLILSLVSGILFLMGKFFPKKLIMKKRVFHIFNLVDETCLKLTQP